MTKNKVDTQFVALWQSGVKLRQPNIVTKSSFNYSLVQMKVFILMIDNLQAAIQEHLNGKQIGQLTLFSQPEKDTVKLSIPLKKFGLSANRYDELRMAAEQMCSISIELPEHLNVDGELIIGFASLIAKAECKKQYARVIDITLLKDVAEYLIAVDKGYTKYIKEVILLLDSPYAMKLYMYLSSWKDKGGCAITMVNFRKLLSIEKKYPSYRHIKQWILDPCSAQLKNCGDIWFEVSPQYNEGEKEPHKLMFSIQKRASTRTELNALNNYRNSIEGVLHFEFKFSQLSASEIANYVDNDNLMTFNQKLDQLRSMSGAQLNEINDYQAYCFEALRKIVAPGNVDVKYAPAPKLTNRNSAK